MGIITNIIRKISTIMPLNQDELFVELASRSAGILIIPCVKNTATIIKVPTPIISAIVLRLKSKRIVVTTTKAMIKGKK